MLQSTQRCLLFVTSAALALSACHVGGGARADELAIALRAEQAETFVREVALHAPENGLEVARERAHSPSVRTLIEQGHLDFETEPMLRELVTMLYAERDYEPVFVYGTQLTPDGLAVVEAIEGAWRHGLYGSDFYGDEILERVSTLQGASSVQEIYDRLRLSEEDQDVLLSFVMDNVGFDDTMPAEEAVFAAISAESADNPLPEFAEAVTALSTSLEEVAVTVPELELLLASSYLRYARTQRFDNLHYITDDQLLAHGWDVEDETQHDEIVRAQLGANFRHATAGVGFAVALDELPPEGEQYERLMEGLLRYRGYVEGPQWPIVEIRRDELNIGRSDPGVPVLRQRLALEGYWDGDLENDEYSTELSRAVREYQETHQISDSVILNDETLSSINTPPDERLAQIEVTMQRWRGNRIGHDMHGEYIWINVPDFHAELWDQDEIVRRWRVIVGSRETYRDADGVYQTEGRTVLFSDTLQYLVFNPYWNVPPSIFNQEMMPEWEQNPLYFIENHFEVEYSATTGRPRNARQLPGPWNALGLVKFLFPNEHDIYMHDTPNRRLFDRTIRAFSHGCIRVDDPFGLAHTLLMRDRDWTEYQTDSYITRTRERAEEQWTSLERPIAVHLEYYVVRGDEDGRMNFLADIYRYDRPLVDAAQTRIREAFGLPALEVDDDE